MLKWLRGYTVMPGFRHILFPVDFSERSQAVRPYVKFFAQQFKARLTLLNVVQMPPGIYGGMDASFPVVFDFPSVEGQVAGLLKDFMGPEDSGPGTVETVVQHGDPAAMISDYVHKNGVDLVMMGTHGYGRFRSLLLGSVASKVLHDADCAVWTSAHTDDPKLLSHLPCRNILAAVDPPDGTAGDLICKAAEIAREFDAQLRLVHAVPGAIHHPMDTGGEEFRTFLLKVAREEIEKIQAHARTSFALDVEAGAVGEVVKRAALENRADMVVIGRGVTHETMGRLRSRAYDIIRESPCPVLSL